MTHRLATPILLALLAGCGSAPPPAPLTAPPLESGVRYFAGTALSGSQPDPEAADRVDRSDATDVRCTVGYAERMPWDAMALASTRTRLIVSARGENPLLPISDLGVGVRVGAGEVATEFLARVEGGELGQTLPVFELRGVVPRGVTAAFTAQPVDAVVTDEGEVVRKLVSLWVGREREDGAPTIALVLEDVAPERTRRSSEDAAPRQVLKRQIILLEDVPTLDGAPLALVIPWVYESGVARAFYARIEFHSPDPDDPRFAEAVGRCVDDLREEARVARAASSSVEASERRAVALATSLHALDLAQNHRPALAFLAGQTDAAPLALDLALSGDDATLASWAQLVAEATGRTPTQVGTPVQADFAWTLERTAFELLADRLDREDLTLELRGMLCRHAGEAGRFPGTLASLLARALSHDELAKAIVDENIGFLEAADPSARVRAFDWLSARGSAPPDYDPLGERTARRTALDRHRAAEAAR